MLALAIESATEQAAVALADETGVISTASLSGGRRHAETITPEVEFCCRRAGLSLSDLDGICVDVGPGLFTGLRVGIASAKGFAFALGVPVSCATSLEVLARAIAGAGMGRDVLLVPVVDARRGEVFSASFRVGSRSARRVQIVEAGEEVCCSPEELAESLGAVAGQVVLCGDGAGRYAPLFEEHSNVTFAPSHLGGPPVEVLAAIGIERLASGEGMQGVNVAPRYMRDADVRINWERRLTPRPAAGASG